MIRAKWIFLIPLLEKFMHTLATTVNGLKFTNPFVISSEPPGTNVKVIKRVCKEGWAGVIAKTVSLDYSKVINVTPRYGKLMANNGKEQCPQVFERYKDLGLLIG
jgi:hypothetical protein